MWREILSMRYLLLSRHQISKRLHVVGHQFQEHSHQWWQCQVQQQLLLMIQHMISILQVVMLYLLDLIGSQRCSAHSMLLSAPSMLFHFFISLKIYVCKLCLFRCIIMHCCSHKVIEVKRLQIIYHSPQICNINF